MPKEQADDHHHTDRSLALPVPSLDHLLQGDERQSLICVFQTLEQIVSETAESGPQQMLEGLLALICQTAQAEAAIYFQLEEENQEMVVKAACGSPETTHLVGLRMRQNPEMLAPKTILGSTCVVGDLYSDPLWLRTALPSCAGQMENLIILPVENHDQPDTGAPHGVIHLFNFIQADMGLLQLLASRLGFELTRWQKYAKTYHTNQRLHALIEAIGQIAGTLDRNELLHMVTQKAAQLLEAERSSLFIIDPETRQTLYQVAYQPDINEQNASKELKSNQAPHKPREMSFLTRSAVTVPLAGDTIGDPSKRNSGVTLGGLTVLNKDGEGFVREDAQFLEILAEQASTFLQVADLYESTEELFLDAIKALVAAIDAKDPGTQGHSQRVSDYSMLIAQQLGLPASQMTDIRISSLMHDIGKIGVPDAILNKKGKLTAEEIAHVQRHPVVGANILRQVQLLKNILPGILEHHERLDGSGYPFGLRGDQISTIGRIVMVADVFDAMTSDRPYRPAISVRTVLNYLRQNAGILYDSACVKALEVILDLPD